jgi:hypothetical protein
MWIGWKNPQTGKSERIYNYYEPDDPAGRNAIAVARRALAQKFNVGMDAVPGFHVRHAGWQRLPMFLEVKRSKTPANIPD